MNTDEVRAVAYTLAGQKALTRLIDAHRDEYERYTAEELAVYYARMDSESFPSLLDSADINAGGGAR